MFFFVDSKLQVKALNTIDLTRGGHLAEQLPSKRFVQRSV